MTDDQLAADREFIAMWAIEQYDEIVARYPDTGVTSARARAIFVREYVEAVRSGDIPRVPFPDEGVP